MTSLRRYLKIAAIAAVVAALSPIPQAIAGSSPAMDASPIPVTHYRTANIDGIDIFYREAGPADAPVVLLLHGFPTSSHMFRNLIPQLASRYHVIAPDYPGFGQSAAPDHKEFAYTFAHYADLMDGLLGKLGVKSYAMYVMDYGAPVGYRLALKHPERVSALIIQNGNAYEEGLKKFWDPIKAYWADGSPAHRKALEFLMKPETTRFQYTDGMSDISRIDPDNYAARPDPAGSAREHGYPARSLLRLRIERAALYQISGLLPGPKAADADRMGEERFHLPGGWCRSVSARFARRRVASDRHRSLRTRGQGGRNGPPDPQLSRTKTAGILTSGIR